MKVTEFIRKIRAKAMDNDEIKYSDYDILRALNVAYKIFRQICLTDAPEIVSENYRCEVPKGNNTIIFDSAFINLPNDDVSEEDDEEEMAPVYIACNPIKVMELRSRGRTLHSASMKNIIDSEATGYPREYVLGNYNGNRCLMLFPIPADDVSISMILIDETKELTINDDVKIPNDYAYYLVDFIVSALAGAGDAGEFRESVALKLRTVLPDPCVVDGYY